jgi:hypothetical protein
VDAGLEGCMLGFGLPAFWARDVRGEMDNWLGEKYLPMAVVRPCYPHTVQKPPVHPQSGR